jgi:hypothetical protein
MLIDEFMICPKLKYFYYLLKGSSLKRAGGRDRGPEALRLVKVGSGALRLLWPEPRPGTEKRLIEDR